jgi:hypothetical protein
MAKKNRATFAKREKERARLSKQAEKRQKRQQTPDPNAAQIPGPMPLMPLFADDVDENGDVVDVDVVDVVDVDGERGVEPGDETTQGVAVDEVAHAADASREP